MTERMPPAEPAPDDRRQRWWQRRPPADHTEFARGVWWAGHVQLFVAAALVVVCLPLFVGGLVVLPGDSAGSSAATLSKLAGELQEVILGLAMAGPFALSGKMLRASSGWTLYRRRPIGGGILRRLVGLVASIAGIALISVVLTAGAVWALIPLVDAAVRLSGA